MVLIWDKKNKYMFVEVGNSFIVFLGLFNILKLSFIGEIVFIRILGLKI